MSGGRAEPGTLNLEPLGADFCMMFGDFHLILLRFFRWTAWQLFLHDLELLKSSQNVNGGFKYETCFDRRAFGQHFLQVRLKMNLRMRVL
jgi:hypothetical protein